MRGFQYGEEPAEDPFQTEELTLAKPPPPGPKNKPNSFKFDFDSEMSSSKAEKKFN